MVKKHTCLFYSINKQVIIFHIFDNQFFAFFVIDSAEKAKHKTDLSTEIGVKLEIIPYFILKKVRFTKNTLSLII